MADENIPIESLPPVDLIISDGAFKSLPLGEKNFILGRYFETASKADPELSQVAPLVTQVVGLEHQADRETPIRSARIRAEIPAYVNAFEAARSGAPREEVLQTFQTQLEEAQKAETQARYKRETDLQLGAEYESLNSGVNQNVDNFFEDSANALDAIGNSTPTTSRRQDIESISGRTPEQLQALALENKIISGQAPTPAGVDSEGEVHFNTTKLLTDKEGVRKYVEGLTGVPENAKKRALDSLDSAYDRTVAQTASRLGDLPLADDRSAKILTNIDPGTPLTEVVFQRAKSLQKNEEPITDENLAAARSEVLRDVLKSEEGRNWFSRGVIEAGLDFRSLGQAIDQTAQAAGVDVDLPGIDVRANTGVPDIETGQVTNELDLQRQTLNMGREQDAPGTVASFGEGLVRILPQILVTRGVGAGAGTAGALSARAFGASATQAATAATRAATTAAIGFGGLQSASGAIEQARNNGVSEEGQLTAGMLGFLTTVGVTSGFSALGRGGVEDFTRKVVGSRREFATALGRAGLGEAGEEAADQILNSFTSGAIANPNADLRDIAMESIQAGLYGFIFGAGTNVGNIEIAPRNAPTADQSNEQLKKRADAILAVDTLLPRVPTLSELTEGRQRLAELEAVDLSAESRALPIETPESVQETAQTEPVVVNETPVGETQTNLSRTDETQTPFETVTASEENPPNVTPTEDSITVPVENGPNVTENETQAEPNPESETSPTPTDEGTTSEGVSGIPLAENGVVAESPRSSETGPANVTLTDDTNPTESPTADGPTRDGVQLQPKAVAAPDTPQPVAVDPEPTASLSNDVAEEAPAGAETPVRELTRADVTRINRIAESVGTDTAVQDNARNRITDELLKNPEASDAILRRAARFSASSREDLTASERAARSTGRVASLDAGENATLADVTPAEIAAPDVAVDSTDRILKTREAISRLTPREQAAVNGGFEGRPDAEVASELGISVNSLRQARNKAREKLANDPTLREAVDANSYSPRSEVTQDSDETLVDRLKSRWSLAPQLRPMAQRIKVATRLAPDKVKAINQAKSVGRFLNVKVVAVDGLPASRNGLYNRSIDGVVYISSNTSRPEFMVVIHEALHNYANTNRVGYERLLTEVAPDLQAFARNRPELANNSEQVLGEEFLADFMADRLTDPAFVNSLAEKNPSVFREFATMLRSLIAKLLDGRMGTERFVKDLQRADAALADALTQLRLRESFGIGTGDENMFETRNPQTNGEQNPEVFYTQTSVTEATQVLERNYFNWKETPLDDVGIRETEQFLVNLLQPEFVKAFQQRLLDTVESITDYNMSSIAPAVGQVAIYNYIARLGEVNKTEQLRLLRMARRVTGGIRGFTDGTIDASLAGTYLRALQNASGGGSAAALFELEFKGREDYLDKDFNKEVMDFLKSADLTPPGTIVEEANISNAQREANVRLNDSLEVGLLASRPDIEAYVKEVETRAKKIYRQVLDLYKGLAGENLNETKAQRLERLLDTDGDLTEIADLAEDLVGQLQTNPQIRALMDTARSEKTEATRRRERATGRSKTSNPVDIHAKRLIGVVSRFDNERKTQSDETKAKFDALVAQDLGRSEFEDEYVKIGGSQEVSSDLFDAVQTRRDRQAGRAAVAAAAREVREQRRVEEATARATKSREAALQSIQAQVDALGQPARDARRPTAKNDTFAKAFSRFVNIKNASLDPSTFEQQLREFVGKNGEPILTEDQVQEIAGKAIAARQDALAVRSAQLEADRRVAEAAADARVFGREVERLERVFDTPQTRDRARKSLATLIQEESIINPSRSITTEAERLAFAVEVQTAAGVSTEDAMSRAQNMVANPDKNFVVAGKRSLRQIIEEEIINSPSRRVQTEAEQISFAESVLREMTDLAPKDIPGVARRMMQDITNRTEEAINKAVQPFFKNLINGNLTADQISKAIRLQALDPSKDFLTSVAALKGWDGLKDSESAQLLEWERQINLLPDKAGAAATSLQNKQHRLILAASGIDQPTMKLMSSFAVARMFSGIGTQLIGVWAIGNQMTNLITRSTLSGIFSTVKNPAAGIRELTQFHIGATRAFGAARAAYVFTLKQGVSPTKQLQAGQESKAAALYVDPLTRAYDTSSRKLAAMVEKANRNPNQRPEFWQRLKQNFVKYGLASSRFSLRHMSAIDAFATLLHSEAKTHFRQLQAAKTAGITDADFDSLWQSSRDLQSSFENYLREDVGLTDPSTIKLEVFNRLQGAMTQGLVLRGADVGKTRAAAVADIREKLGVGETPTAGLIGKATSGLANAISKSNLSSVLPAVRTGGNLIDAALWSFPAYNIVHAVRARRLKANDPTGFQERFPNLLEDWQLRERTQRALMSNLKFFGAIAPLVANAALPDEEKWFWYTGNYPIDPAGRAKFQKQRRELGWDADMLIVGPLRIPMGRGVAEDLRLPLMVARFVADASDAKGFTGVDLVNVTQSLGQALVPGFSQVGGTFKKTETEGGIKSFVTNELVLKPLGFSGIFKDPRRLLGDTVDVKASDAWVNLTDPFYTDQDVDGIVTMKSVLGERLQEDANPMRWMADLRLPLSWQVPARGRDPVKKTIADDFIRIGYSGGRYSLNNFKEKLQEGGKEYSPELWTKFNEARIREFQKNYIADRAELLRKKDPSASIGSVWSKATPKALEAIGIREKD